MKERTAHITVKRKSYIGMLFIFIAGICLSVQTNGQGWSFTIKMSMTGNCAGVTPPVIPVQNLGIPTKSLCEYFRQQILLIKGSTDKCTVGFICSACTGSDIIIPGQVNPGEVSFDGQFEGKPLFTTHQSSAFEDWARDYKQQLESYGITSILGKNITSSQIPLTGYIDFDKFYYSQSAEFNPTTPPAALPVNPYEQDPSVVDLSGKEGIVDLLRTDEDIKKEDEWLQEQGLDINRTIPEDGIPELDESNFKLEEGDFWTTPEMIDLYIETGKFALMFTGEGAVATVVKSAVSFTEDYRTIKDVVDGKDPAGSKTITVNTLKKAAVEDALIPAGEQAIGSIYGEKGKIIYKIAVYDAKAIWGAVTNSNNNKK